MKNQKILFYPSNRCMASISNRILCMNRNRLLMFGISILAGVVAGGCESTEPPSVVVMPDSRLVAAARVLAVLVPVVPTNASRASSAAIRSRVAGPCSNFLPWGAAPYGRSYWPRTRTHRRSWTE